MNFTLAVLVAVAAATIYGLLGVCFQVAGEKRLDILGFLFWKQLIGTAFAAALWWSLDPPAWRGGLVLVAALGALSYVATVGAYLMATREREIGASWTILNLSVVLPIAVSVLWFGESFTTWKALGVALTLGSVVLIGGGWQAGSFRMANARWVKWIALAFLLNGWLATLLRFVGPDEGPAFTLGFYGISFLIILVISLLARKPPAAHRTMLLIAGGGAATHLGGMVLTLLALNLMAPVSASPGVVVYPITNGLVIPIGVIMGLLILKQKTERNTVIGIGLGMAALVLFCI